MVPHAIATLFMGRVLVPLLGEWNALKTAFFLAAVFTLPIPFVQNKGLLLTVQIFCGFSLGLIFPLLLGLAIDKIAPEKRATAMGAYQAIYAAGIFAGPFFAGIFNSLMGIKAGFYFVGVLGLLATLLIIIWGKDHAELTIEKSIEKSKARA